MVVIVRHGYGGGVETVNLVSVETGLMELAKYVQGRACSGLLKYRESDDACNLFSRVRTCINRSHSYTVGAAVRTYKKIYG